MLGMTWMDEHTNSLNAEEQQRLRELAADLERDDPRFVALFGSSPLRRVTAQFGRSKRRTALVIGVVVGTAALAVGLAVASPVIGFIGFAITLTALHFGISHDYWWKRFATWIGLGRTDDP